MAPPPTAEQLLRRAFVEGWALSGGPMTPQVRAGCQAAIELALTHLDDPRILEATLRLGHLEGVWAQIYARRDELHADNRAVLLALWRPMVADLDIDDMVRRVVREAAASTEALSDLSRRIRDRIVSVVQSVLRQVQHTGAWRSLRTATAAALRRGLAEGQTGAIAYNADQLGRIGLDWEIAFEDAYKALEDTPGLLEEADEWLTRALGDQGSVLGRRLAALARDGASRAEMVDATEDLLGEAAPVGLIVDQLTARAMSRGALDLYASENVQLVDFLTAGDVRVCQQCADAEANGPYRIIDAPVPGLHPLCRCTVAASAPFPIPASLDRLFGDGAGTGVSRFDAFDADDLDADAELGDEDEPGDAGDDDEPSEDEDTLAQHIATGTADTEWLGGGSAARTELVTFNDGAKAVLKVDRDDPVRAADAEELASAFGRALGVDVPEVVRESSEFVYLDFVDAPAAAEVIYVPWGADPLTVSEIADLADSVAGRRLGLFDMIIGNTDRNTGNFLVGEDGRLVGIDHGYAFQIFERQAYDPENFDPMVELMKVVTARRNAFARRLLEVTDDGVVGGSRSFSTADLQRMREVLAGLRSRFTRMDRIDWYDAAMARIRWLEDYADGDGTMW